MKNDFMDLRAMEFVPLSEVKAKLSQVIRRLSEGKREAVTINGRPEAVLLSYRDYLTLLSFVPTDRDGPEDDVILLEEWEKDRSKREMVRDSIANLFDAASLSRKGQKAYKKETVDGFRRRP